MLGFFLLFSEPMGNGGGVQIICMHHMILLAFSSVDYILQKKVIAKVFYSCSMFKNLLNLLGTIHLRRRQIFTIFDPYPLSSAFQQSAYEGDF